MIRANSAPAAWPLELNKLSRIVSMWRDDLARRHGRARRLARRGTGGLDLLAWGQKFLPAHFRRPPSNMHRWLAEQCDAAQTARGTKLNVLGPRGGAKSTIGTLALPLRAAVECWEPYIWIVSDTKHQACAHLENIKAELLENRRLAEEFPDVVGRGLVWRANAIVLRNGVTIEAFGTGQRLRGRRRREHRPTLIICDDLQNDQHTGSAVQRDHSRNWFHGTLMKAGTARTNVVNLATALHRDALAMELHRTPGWTSRVFRSIVRWPENMALWQQWEAIYTDLSRPQYQAAARSFYEQHRPAMDAGAIVLWPEEESLYTLMCMRVEGGRTAFEREKQNAALQPELCEWPEAYFDESIWFETWPANPAIKTMALDPSKGSDARRGDYSALVLLGVDRQGVLYVEADLARRPTPEMVAEAAEWFGRFQPDLFGVESNQFQDLLAGQFEAEFRRRGVLGARPAPIENRVPKQVRIRRLGPYLSSHRLRLKCDSPGTRLLLEQLREFPLGDHDDGPDALEMAIRLAGEVLHGRAAKDRLGHRLPVGQ
jgi:predicted phage terminase large subunit-like protein